MDDERPSTSNAAKRMVTQQFKDLTLEDIDDISSGEDFDNLDCSDFDEDDLLAIEEMMNPKKRAKPNLDTTKPSPNLEEPKPSPNSEEPKPSPNSEEPKPSPNSEEPKPKEKNPSPKKTEKGEEAPAMPVKRKKRVPKVWKIDQSTLNRIVDEEEDEDYDFPVRNTKSNVEDVLTALELTYEVDRAKVTTSDGFISTPLHALKELCTSYNETIHNEMVFIPHEPSGQSTTWVEIIVGKYHGIGEAFKSKQATQMAALDLLIQLEAMGTFRNIRPYALYPGWRIKNTIIRDLADFCRINSLKPPKFDCKSNIDQPEMPIYTAECSIGGMVVSVGHSDHFFVAKKLAAFNAIDYLSGVKYPKEFVAFGNACTSLLELKALGYKRHIPKSQTKLLEETDAVKQADLVDMADQDLEHDAGFLSDEMWNPANLKSLKVTISCSVDKKKPTREVKFG